MAIFFESICQVRGALTEVSRRLARVQKEINPLKAKGKNPIKKVVSSFVKAKRTKAPKDIAATRSAHHVGVLYANQHGLPRLAKQLSTHQTKIPKPKKFKKKPVPKKSVTRSATKPSGR